MDVSPLSFDVSSVTHAGKVRERNEDSCLVRTDVGLWAVADGMGGHEAGDLASRTLVESLNAIGKPEAALDLVEHLNAMGQQLLAPPNVKGWDGGAAWLNSQTVLTRENFASSLMAQMGKTPWVQRTMQSLDPASVSRALTTTILQGDVSPASTAHLAAYLEGSNVSALAALSGENADERIRGAAYLTMAMPAYQLA